MFLLPLIIVAGLIALSELIIYTTNTKQRKQEIAEFKKSTDQYHLKVANLKGFDTVVEWEKSFKK